MSLESTISEAWENRANLSPTAAPPELRSAVLARGTRLDESRDTTRYLIGLLVFLGLLGTFWGLATTVPAVVETIRSLAPQEGESANARIGAWPWTAGPIAWLRGGSGAAAGRGATCTCRRSSRRKVGNYRRLPSPTPMAGVANAAGPCSGDEGVVAGL